MAIYIRQACLYSRVHPTIPSHRALRVVFPIFAISWGVTIAASRVWLGHHTWPQVLVGCTCGVAIATMWFALWTTYGLDEYGKVLEQALAPYTQF